MSSNVKRSITLNGRKTSVSLEEPFWRAFRMIAKQRRARPAELLAEIDSARERSCNLSSAIRMFVLGYYVSQHEEGSRTPR
jgi:predicted DNA-binding ribbon-helix-helix protein